jgi:hypothetical protein
MTLKNWLRRSVLACGISLLAAQPAAQKTPAFALIDSADEAQWQTWAKELGWQVIAPAAPSGGPLAIDARVQALAAAVQEAIKSGSVDPNRVYAVGRGDEAATVFYTISRTPDLWAAGLALGGSPQAAINSNRLWAANFTDTPVMWVSSGPEEQPLADQLKSRGVNLEWRDGKLVTTATVFQWLAQHTRAEFPAAIDCETNSPTFARCYWIEMTKFDPNERNDVLPATLVPPGATAMLDLGNFFYKTDDPGPGLLISKLADKYSGPLKVNDRIVALEGRPIENAQQFIQTMGKMTDDRPATVTVQRGKERIRVETHILITHHDPVLSARVQGKYDAEGKQILIISRTVTEMKVTVPPAWLPASLNWNGLAIETLKDPGCHLLKVEKELLHAGTCQ